MQNSIIVTVYKPQNASVNDLCQALLALHREFEESKKIIFGDFNIDWSKPSAPKEQLTKFMVDQLNCKQIINGPTNDFNSTIDLVFTNMTVK